jgi:hypothetical protein
MRPADGRPSDQDYFANGSAFNNVPFRREHLNGNKFFSPHLF